MLPFHDGSVIHENIIAKILFASCSAKISYRKNFRAYGIYWSTSYLATAHWSCGFKGKSSVILFTASTFVCLLVWFNVSSFYNSFVWLLWCSVDPLLAKQVRAMERIHSKVISTVQHLRDRLSSCFCYSLVERHKFHALVQIFRILHKMAPL